MAFHFVNTITVCQGMADQGHSFPKNSWLGRDCAQTCSGPFPLCSVPKRADIEGKK